MRINSPLLGRYLRPSYVWLRFRGCALWVLGVALQLLLVAGVLAQDRSLPLTAAYVYYFTKFVSWPNTDPQKIICVVSANHLLHAEFEKVVSKANGAIAVVFTTAMEGDSYNNIAACHIVYFAQDSAPKKFKLPSHLATLLVADETLNMPDVAVRLVLDGSKLGFEINRSNARARGLEISAKLLNLAKEVKD